MKEDISDGFVYSYGIYNGRSNIYGRSNDQRVAVAFSKETNIVKSVSITFADLSKEY